MAFSYKKMFIKLFLYECAHVDMVSAYINSVLDTLPPVLFPKLGLALAECKNICTETGSRVHVAV